MKGVVASGHPLTSKAAENMLALGGNAFDAVISAGFASVITEPTLTSLGGGGFLLTHIANSKKNVLFDFFVNTPGMGSKEVSKPAMQPVEIKFPGCTQIFHTGINSVAVPGMLKGLMHIHKQLCTLSIETILSPAVGYLEEGVEINDTQGLFFEYLKPIFTLDDYGKEIYIKNGRFVKQFDRVFNPLLKKFLKRIPLNDYDIHDMEITGEFIKTVKEQNGLVSQEDIDAYMVIEREPLCIPYRDREIIVNPPPSTGGVMLALSLKLLEDINFSACEHGSEGYYTMLIELMKLTDIFRSVKKRDWIEKITYPFADILTSPLIQSYKENVPGEMFISTQGTTQISIIDELGNAASMTTSNGSGSGYFIPESGIMLNNMMGEDDLHPDGFFQLRSGKRVSSMMTPVIIMKDGKVETVMGSGGSKRIKTAILHVLINIIDYNNSLKEAIEAPRIHFENNDVHAEPEISEKILKMLRKNYNINVWEEKNMYFGGVHAVNNNMDGWGDSRRGGNFLRCGYNY